MDNTVKIIESLNVDAMTSTNVQKMSIKSTVELGKESVTVMHRNILYVRCVQRKDDLLLPKKYITSSLFLKVALIIKII
jgi:hypothetical protein